MPIAITEEQRALQAAVRDWAKSVDPIAAVRRLEPASGADAAGAGRAAGLAWRSWVFSRSRCPPRWVVPTGP